MNAISTADITLIYNDNKVTIYAETSAPYTVWNLLLIWLLLSVYIHSEFIKIHL